MLAIINPTLSYTALYAPALLPLVEVVGREIALPLIKRISALFFSLPRYVPSFSLPGADALAGPQKEYSFRGSEEIVKCLEADLGKRQIDLPFIDKSVLQAVAVVFANQSIDSMKIQIPFERVNFYLGQQNLGQEDFATLEGKLIEVLRKVGGEVKENKLIQAALHLEDALKICGQKKYSGYSVTF